MQTHSKTTEFLDFSKLDSKKNTLETHCERRVLVWWRSLSQEEKWIMTRVLSSTPFVLHHWHLCSTFGWLFGLRWCGSCWLGTVASIQLFGIVLWWIAWWPGEFLTTQWRQCSYCHLLTALGMHDWLEHELSICTLKMCERCKLATLLDAWLCTGQREGAVMNCLMTWWVSDYPMKTMFILSSSDSTWNARVGFSMNCQSVLSKCAKGAS